MANTYVPCETCGHRNGKGDLSFQFGWRWLFYGMALPFIPLVLKQVFNVHSWRDIPMESWMLTSVCVWWGIVMVVGITMLFRKGHHV